MKKIFSAITLAITCMSVFAQHPSTDIFIIDMKLNDGAYTFGKPYNFTSRPGYDNQPSFTLNSKKILYVSQRDTTQTDIYEYDIKDSTTTQITNTNESEYSPVIRKDEKWISVVRVDLDKAQRLYLTEINQEEEPWQVLSFQDSVAYYGWIDDSTVACAMLNGKTMDLQIFDVPSQQFVKLMSNVGRCMTIIPGSDEFSFTQKTTDSTATIFRYNNKTGDYMPLCDLPVHSEDYAFTPEGKLLTGQKGKLLMYDSGTEKGEWKEIANFSKNVGDFYRIAISPKGDRIAVVSFKGKKP